MDGHFGQTHFKVSHPNVSNNIPQMKSSGFQAPFIAGGNQIGYYLGIQSNANTTPEIRGKYSTFKKIIKRHF